MKSSALAAASTPTAEIRREGPKRSLRSRVSMLANETRGPARDGRTFKFAAPAVVSTPVAEDCLFRPTPWPRSRRRRPRSAALARLPRRVSTPATEIHSCGPLPFFADRLWSRRRRPRTASFAAAVARLPRRGLDAGAAEIRSSGPTPSPRSRRWRPRSAAVARLPPCALDAGGRDPPRWPDSLSALWTPAAEIRRGGPTPSPRSRRRQPGFAAVARLPQCAPAAEIRLGGPTSLPHSRRHRPRSAAAALLPLRGLYASGRDPPLRPDSLAALLTPAAENRLFFPPHPPRFRRRRPGSAAVARCLDAGGRGPPLCPAALATCLFF
jgi:hypothetical protein